MSESSENERNHPEPPASEGGARQQDIPFDWKWYFRLTLRQARRLVVTVVGVTLIILGLIMVVTPGPALVIIPAGLAVLATEFLWARRVLKAVRFRIEGLRQETVREARHAPASDPDEQRRDEA